MKPSKLYRFIPWLFLVSACTEENVVLSPVVDQLSGMYQCRHRSFYSVNAFREDTLFVKIEQHKNVPDILYVKGYRDTTFGAAIFYYVEQHNKSTDQYEFKAPAYYYCGGNPVARSTNLSFSAPDSLHLYVIESGKCDSASMIYLREEVHGHKIY